MTAQSSEAQLSCGCVRSFTPLPSVGDTIYCTRHPQTVCTVVSLVDRTWRARCRTYRCRYGRLGNEAEVEAFANRHTLNYPDHEVAIFHNDVQMRTVSLDGPTLPIERPTRIVPSVFGDIEVPAPTGRLDSIEIQEFPF